MNTHVSHPPAGLIHGPGSGHYPCHLQCGQHHEACCRGGVFHPLLQEPRLPHELGACHFKHKLTVMLGLCHSNYDYCLLANFPGCEDCPSFPHSNRAQTEMEHFALHLTPMHRCLFICGCDGTSTGTIQIKDPHVS